MAMKFLLCLLASTVKSESGSLMNMRENTTIDYFQGTLNLPSALVEYTISSSSSLPLHTIPISVDGISISPSLASQNPLVSSLDLSFSQQLTLFLTSPVDSAVVSPVPTVPSPIDSVVVSPSPTVPSPVDSVVVSPSPTYTLSYTDELFSFTHEALESSTLTRVQGSSVISDIQVTPTNIPTEFITNEEYTLPVTRGSTEVPTINTNISAAAIAGIVLALTIAVASFGLTSALLICFCCCCLRSKYKHSTENEQRLTIHQWNITSGQHMMNCTNLVGMFGSGRSQGSIQSGGSNLFGSLGFMRRHSSSADQLSSAINYSIPDLYSTPV